jgi:hypothetical protein
MFDLGILKVTTKMYYKSVPEILQRNNINWIRNRLIFLELFVYFFHWNESH